MKSRVSGIRNRPELGAVTLFPPSAWASSLTDHTCSFVQETQIVMTELPEGISVIPDMNNVRYFKVEMAGPKDVSFTKNDIARNNWTRTIIDRIFPVN